MEISDEATQLYEDMAKIVVKLAKLGYIWPQKKPVESLPLQPLLEVYLNEERSILFSSANDGGGIISVTTSQTFIKFEVDVKSKPN